MAKICRECGSWCAHFLLFLWISAVLSLDDYNFYDFDKADHRFEYSLSLEPLQDQDDRVHQLQKRELLTFAGPPSHDNSSSPLLPATNETAEEITVPSKSKLFKLTKALNLTKVALKDTYPKNLGVNGTGQRKDIDVKPILLSSPYNNTTVPPLVHGNGTGIKTNQTNKSDEDVDIEKIVDEDDKYVNETLLEHNITVARKDYHLYYNSTLLIDSDAGHHYWVDLDNRSDVTVHDLLSKSHRRAATVKLSFDFPFYGHLIKNVTIATGGFLYTGDYVHSWLAATQYVAPLMANFDTSISNDSCIRYSDNGTAFTVEWVRVSLQDKPNEGEFTFQATLHKNGDIVFVYKTVPFFIKEIGDDHHPVKVGLSDAYIIDRTIFFVRRKTIYEYHRVNFFKEDIKNWTVIYLKALPTCLDHADCASCLLNPIPSFKCVWCPGINRCSNGIDRRRQDWLMKGCDKTQLSNESQCAHISGQDIFDEANITYSHDVNEFNHKIEDHSSPSRIYNNSNSLGPDQSVRMGVSGVVAILFLLAMVAGLAVWVLYAYRNPHTTSGQILIRYRPSQWRWRRGEARYTAATIHM